MANYSFEHDISREITLHRIMKCEGSMHDYVPLPCMATFIFTSLVTSHLIIHKHNSLSLLFSSPRQQHPHQHHYHLFQGTTIAMAFLGLHGGQNLSKTLGSFRENWSSPLVLPKPQTNLKIKLHLELLHPHHSCCHLSVWKEGVAFDSLAFLTSRI